jgi:hypothetical protein
MKNLILGFVLCSSIGAYAADVDYKYCNKTTDMVYQLAKVDGQKLPNLFEIGEDGRLTVNEDHAKLISFDTNESDSVQTYKFKTMTEKRSLLRLFRNNDTKIEQLEYSFTVQKDSKGRIKSITQKNSCIDCVGGSKLEFTYSKNRCVPTLYVSENLEGKKAIVTDTLVCRDIVEGERELIKKMRKGKKCMSDLNEQYVLNQDRMQKHIKRLKTTTDELENGTESDLSKRLATISDLSKKLSKPLTKYAEMSDDEFDVKVSTSEIIAECLKTLDKSMLKGSKVFDGNLIRREDTPVIASEPVQSEAIDQ